MISLTLKFQSFELLLTWIHYSLASLSVLFKQKSLSFVKLSLFLRQVSIFWLEHLIFILLNLQSLALKVQVLWCKIGIYSWNISEKVYLMYEDSFPSHLYQPLFYS